MLLDNFGDEVVRGVEFTKLLYMNERCTVHLRHERLS